MSNRIGMYPGTFDPITIGHADLIKRALNVVDELVVAVVMDNNNKQTIFSYQDRAKMIEAYLPEILSKDELSRISVKAFSGLLVNFAQELGSKIIFRGIRAVSDFEYEFQLACVNARLNEEVQTIFLPASERNQYISSRFVKEVARLGGDLSSFSCKFVIEKLLNYYKL